MRWSWEALYGKAQRRWQVAQGFLPTDPEYAFQLSLCMEFLGRAALAKKSPALLADPQAGGGDSLIEALGLGTAELPRSIQAKTVWLRCERLVTGFSPDDRKFCESLAEKRNEEIHSGEAAYVNYSADSWQPRFFRASKILLASLERSLDDAFGPEPAAAAEAMIVGLGEDVAAAVAAAIATARGTWEALDDDTCKLLRERNSVIPLRHESEDTRVCPSCGERGVIGGLKSHISTPTFDDDTITVTRTFTPTRFACRCCQLKLAGHAQMKAAGLGMPYTEVDKTDVVEHYAERFEEHFDEGPDYGND